MTLRRDTGCRWEFYDARPETRRPRDGRVVPARPAHWNFYFGPEDKYGLQESGSLDVEAYERARERQQEYPVELVDNGYKGRSWWWYQGSFYWEDEGLEEAETCALIIERGQKRRAKIDRAVSRQQAEQAAERSREPIPDDVKMFVWRRDEGKCVKCGSQENLEFDHIIPRSMGGSDTARNIQLLCAPCNRAKGGDLV